MNDVIFVAKECDHDDDHILDDAGPPGARLVECACAMCYAKRKERESLQKGMYVNLGYVKKCKGRGDV